jgi:hypothetical protein
MAFSGKQKSFCVLQLVKTESIITVQLSFRTKCHMEPQTDKTIREWCRKFKETGYLCAAKRTGRPGSSTETVDPIRESFTRSPQKSTHRASNNFILQQEGAPPHYHLEVRLHLSTTLPQRWIGHTSNEDSALIPWPPKSPDLTLCDFFLWSYVKDKIYMPNLASTENRGCS